MNILSLFNNFLMKSYQMKICKKRQKFSYLKDELLIIFYFTRDYLKSQIVLSREKLKGRAPSFLDKASRYNKRCVEFQWADEVPRRPIFAAYFRTLPSGAKRACTHVYTREKVWTHVHRLRLAGHHACVRAYVHACSLAVCYKQNVRSILWSCCRVALSSLSISTRSASKTQKQCPL